LNVFCQYNCVSILKSEVEYSQRHFKRASLPSAITTYDRIILIHWKYFHSGCFLNVRHRKCEKNYIVRIQMSAWNLTSITIKVQYVYLLTKDELNFNTLKRQNDCHKVLRMSMQNKCN